MTTALPPSTGQTAPVDTLSQFRAAQSPKAHLTPSSPSLRIARANLQSVCSWRVRLVLVQRCTVNQPSLTAGAIALRMGNASIVADGWIGKAARALGREMSSGCSCATRPPGHCIGAGIKCLRITGKHLGVHLTPPSCGLFLDLVLARSGGADKHCRTDHCFQERCEARNYDRRRCMYQYWVEFQTTGARTTIVQVALHRLSRDGCRWKWRPKKRGG
eukprot:SAG31_NODE_567_length_14028_cov_4.022328_4_plen_217_part_00